MSDLSQVFLIAPPFPQTAQGICENVENGESVEETMGFLGKDWSDVSAQDWATHPDAVYFFTAEAFRYFLPSILLAGSKDFDAVNVAIAALIYSLDTDPSSDLFEWNKSRWSGLTIDQRDAVVAWMETQKKSIETYFDKSTLSRITCRLLEWVD